MLELTVGLSAERVLEECARRGLEVGIDRGLGGCPGGRHWHLRIPGRAGTLEVSQCRDRVWVKVHPRRDGGWASALAAELHAMSPAPSFSSDPPPTRRLMRNGRDGSPADHALPPSGPDAPALP